MRAIAIGVRAGDRSLAESAGGAAAWATPVIVLATAAPAAAAVSLPVRSARVVYPESINAASYNAGTVSINDIDIRYDYAAWGLDGTQESAGPATAFAYYTIAVLNAADMTELASTAGGPIAIAKYDTHRESGTINGVPPGDYVFRLTVTSVTFSDSTLPYRFEADVPQIADSAAIMVG